MAFETPVKSKARPVPTGKSYDTSPVNEYFTSCGLTECSYWRSLQSCTAPLWVPTKPRGGLPSLVMILPQVKLARVVKWPVNRFCTLVCSELYSESPAGYPWTTTPVLGLPSPNCGYFSRATYCGTVGDWNH